MKTPESFTCSIESCARCGEDHKSILFMSFLKENVQYQFWGTCPRTGEPVLMKTIEIGDEE